MFGRKSKRIKELEHKLELRDTVVVLAPHQLKVDLKDLEQQVPYMVSYKFKISGDSAACYDVVINNASIEREYFDGYAP